MPRLEGLRRRLPQQVGGRRVGRPLRSHRSGAGVAAAVPVVEALPTCVAYREHLETKMATYGRPDCFVLHSLTVAMEDLMRRMMRFIIIIIFIIVVGACVAVCFLSDCMLMRSAQALASSRRPHHAHKRELRDNTHRNNAASSPHLGDVDVGVVHQL